MANNIMNLSAIVHKNNASRKREEYVPANVKVIEIAAQEIICQSGGEYNNPFGDPTDL